MSDAQILQILGLAYLSVGLGALINPAFYKKILTAYAKNLPVVYLNSFIIFGIGFLLVSFHNVWVFDWPVLVTVLGWAAFLKGLFMLVMPQLYIDISTTLKKNKKQIIAEAAMVFLLGLLLTIVGFLVI